MTDGEMSDGVWRGYEKPGGAPFYAPVPTRGFDCPRIFPRKCYGTLQPIWRREKGKKAAAVECDDCGARFTEDDLLRHGIQIDKIQ